jgi:hypothetical protein
MHTVYTFYLQFPPGNLHMLNEIGISRQIRENMKQICKLEIQIRFYFHIKIKNLKNKFKKKKKKKKKSYRFSCM